MDPMKHTLQPIVTGATVVGMKYSGGVMLITDTLASYGSQARYKGVCRMKKVGKYSLVGAAGEMSDFQYLGNLVDELDDEDFLAEDGCHMGPNEYSNYIGRVLYNRRSKFNPLYNQLLVVGKKGSQDSKLSYVDHQGTSFDEDFCALGFGMHLAMPLLRNEWRPDITFDDAKALAIKCMQLCFYRDCRASPVLQIGSCDGTTVNITEPFTIDHYWGHKLWTEKRLEDSTMVGDTW